MKYIIFIILFAFVEKNFAQNSNEKLNRLSEKMLQKYAERDFSACFSLAQQILKIDSVNLSALHSKMFSAFEIKKTEECIHAAAAIIRNIQLDKLFPYLEDDSKKRTVLRNAYNLKAWLTYLQTEDTSFLESALSDINKCLSITSPIDHDPDENAYLDTKVRILIKLKRMEEAYLTAHKALQSNPNFSDLQDIKNSEGYKTYIKNVNINGWGRFVKGSELESAIQALTRYDSFVKMYEKESSLDLSEYYLEWKKERFNLEDLRKTEQRLDFIFPPDYIEFVTKYGNFSIQSGYDLLKPNEITRLSDALVNEWDHQFLLTDQFKKQKNNLDHMICFANGSEGRQDIWYSVFANKTRNQITGFMDVFPFNQDDWTELTLEQLNPYNGERGGFDSYIQNLINKLIEEILEN